MICVIISQILALRPVVRRLGRDYFQVLLASAQKHSRKALLHSLYSTQIIKERKKVVGSVILHLMEMKGRKSGYLWAIKGRWRWQRPYQKTFHARLSVNLLSVFFTREKLASGNCTPAPNRELLDQKVIHGIRLYLKHIHPITTTKEEENRWKKIVQTSMNARNIRAALKLEGIKRGAIERGPGSVSSESVTD